MDGQIRSLSRGQWKADGKRRALVQSGTLGSNRAAVHLQKFGQRPKFCRMKTDGQTRRYSEIRVAASVH